MDLKDWKQSRKKEIVLESGLTVIIRHLSPFALAELGPIPKLEDASADNQILSAKRIVQSGVIYPKIGEGEEELSLTDLSLEDINEIVDAVVGIGKRPDTLPLAGDSSEAPTPSS